jgi:hypothetical protein
MYEDKKALRRLVHIATRAAWKLRGRDPNALLWYVVETWPLRSLFSKIIPCNVPYLLYQYPKCGMTWIRFMIYLAAARFYPDIPVVAIMKEDLFPEYELPRIRCTHEYLFHRYEKKRGYIMCVRQPERVMVSNYHHTKFRLHHHEMNYHDFIHSKEFGVVSYVKFVENTVTQLKKYRHCIVRYEELRKDTARELEKILHFIELPLQQKEIDEIVAESTLEKMRDAELSGRFDVEWLSPQKESGAQRVRTGGNDSLNSIFSDEDIEFMKNAYCNSRVFNTLGYV